jgi:hypothetical protein
MKYAASAKRDQASGNEAGETAPRASRDGMAHARTLTENEARGQIEEKLRSEPGLDIKKLRFLLTASAVELSGSVRTCEDRQKAVRIAPVLCRRPAGCGPSYRSDLRRKYVRWSQKHNSPVHRRAGCGSPDWDSSCSQVRTRYAGGDRDRGK